MIVGTRSSLPKETLVVSTDVTPRLLHMLTRLFSIYYATCLSQDKLHICSLLLHTNNPVLNVVRKTDRLPWIACSCGQSTVTCSSNSYTLDSCLLTWLLTHPHALERTEFKAQLNIVTAFEPYSWQKKKKSFCRKLQLIDSTSMCGSSIQHKCTSRSRRQVVSSRPRKIVRPVIVTL